jgi:hypothetical protein
MPTDQQTVSEGSALLQNAIVVVKPVMSENSIDRNGPDLNSLQRLWPNDWSRNRAIRRYAAAP